MIERPGLEGGALPRNRSVPENRWARWEDTDSTGSINGDWGRSALLGRAASQTLECDVGVCGRLKSGAAEHEPHGVGASSWPTA
jgi:hypothetical protein